MKARLWLAVSKGSLMLCATANAAELFQLEAQTRPVEWKIEYHGKPLMVYAFAAGQFKPFVKELYTPKGDNLLRNSPFDHLHHHGLMYAIKVNGVNFWEETAGCGIQKVVQTASPVFDVTPQGQPQATITQVLHWVTPEDAFLPDTNAAPLLIEQRRLRLVLDEPAGELALYWNSRFSVGSKTNVVVLTGANYHGLGMRFPQALDAPAVHRTTEGMPDLGGTKQDVSVHPWEAVSFDVPQHPATIALFGHPRNARGDANFFAMHQPFAYLSATQGLDTEPLVYHVGEQFEVNYLVAVYAEIKPTDALNKRARTWQGDLPKP